VDVPGIDLEHGKVGALRLGEPTSDSTGGGGLRWMDYERAGATLALEFDSGGLSCVQLYADGYA
jgi:hypothetical protein